MAPLGFKGKGGALLRILGFRRKQAYSGVIFDGSCDFYAEFIANRAAVRRLPGEILSLAVAKMRWIFGTGSHLCHNLLNLMELREKSLT